jgi:hypothetical protein
MRNFGGLHLYSLSSSADVANGVLHQRLILSILGCSDLHDEMSYVINDKHKSIHIKRSFLRNALQNTWCQLQLRR